MKKLSIFLALMTVGLTSALIILNSKLQYQFELTNYQRDRAQSLAIENTLLKDKKSSMEYNLETPDAGQNDPGDKVVVEWVSDPIEVRRLLTELTIEDNLQKENTVYKGYAYWNHDVEKNGIKKCTIIAPEPFGEYDKKKLEILGHEFYHCIGGHFHEK